MKLIRQLNLYFCMMCLSLDWTMAYLTNRLVSSLFYVPRCKWMSKPKGINSLREYREQNLKFIWQNTCLDSNGHTASLSIWGLYTIFFFAICLKYASITVAICEMVFSIIIIVFMSYLEEENDYKKKITKLSWAKKKEWFIKAHIFLVFPLILLIILVFV